MIHEFTHVGNIVLVRRIAECNNQVVEVGGIAESDSPNPILHLYIPYGFNGLQALMNEFNVWKDMSSPIPPEYNYHFPLPESR